MQVPPVESDIFMRSPCKVEDRKVFHSYTGPDSFRPGSYRMNLFFLFEMTVPLYIYMYMYTHYRVVIGIFADDRLS